MHTTKKSLSAAILTGSALLLTAGLACAQAVVNLTAVRQVTATPDGNVIPMWGWLCGNGTTAAAGNGGTGALAAGGASCTQTNGQAQAIGTTAPSAQWQPPLITVPTGSSLRISLTNSLPVPTSLTIVGQIPSVGVDKVHAADANGPGHPTRESGRPQHAAQTATTWTTVVPSTGWTPPTQGARAQAFVQEACGTLTANNTGTNCTSGTISYSWSALQPGTYLIESGSYASIQGPMGLYGVLVVTQAPSSATGTFAPGIAYPSPAGAATTTGVPYDADAVLLLSEIDAVQNQAADTAVQTAGFSAFTKWSPDCSPTGAHPNTCYPPAPTPRCRP
jgi:hypothetical protein